MSRYWSISFISVSGERDTPHALKDDKELAKEHLKTNLAVPAQVKAPASLLDSSCDSISGILSSESLDGTFDSTGNMEKYTSFCSPVCVCAHWTNV